MTKLKKLPLDVSTFSSIMNDKDNYLYVDKTENIYRLFTGDSRYYFLARPRRFGKSLLVSTLAELFAGNKKLFEGLWIANSDWEWKQHPVIQLDFSKIAHQNPDDLKKSLHVHVGQYAAQYNVDLAGLETLEDKFNTLIVEAAKKIKVVILIDEYDKPIIDHITNLEIAEKNREILKSFYDVLKGLDANLRAIFVTGVSKFSKTSIFSGINNLNDISEKLQAAALLGYTTEELDHYLEPYISNVAQAQEMPKQEIRTEMKEWYNGYRFSKADLRVYNPFSILYYLSDKERKNYWFESGTPTFLMKLLKTKQEALKDFSGSEVTEAELGPFELENLPIITLLYQTGYLTIVDSFKKGNTSMYRLGYPNAEVRESFSTCILVTLTQLRQAQVVLAADAIKEALIDNDIAKVCHKMRILFASIPSKIHISQEYYYQSLFFHTFNLIGFETKLVPRQAQDERGLEDEDMEVDAEVPTDKGFIDMVIKTPHRIFILEMKFNKSPKIALNQVKRKKYYEKYLGLGLPITLAGIDFNYKKKDLKITFVQEQLG